MFQPAQTAKLSKEEHATREAALRRHQQHRFRTLISPTGCATSILRCETVTNEFIEIFIVRIFETR